MQKTPDIRQLYAPVQPTVRRSSRTITYFEFLPHHKLQNFICCYWELKTRQKLHEQFDYTVVADGCMDIFFDMNKPAEPFVMGFCQKYKEFSLDNSFRYIGIRFFPAVFPQIFRINAAELSNRFEPLEAVVPSIAGFIAENFTPDLTIQKIKSSFDRYFLDLMAHTDPYYDNRFHEAIHIILNKSGVVNINRDLDTGVSQRQLRRLFEYYVGVTAKTFSKVVRFQNILKARHSLHSLRESKLFFDAGYYDQAHFIKEFKMFYGVTPYRAFREK